MQIKERHERYGHSFDETTGAYMRPVRIFPESDGTTPLPENTVDFHPLEKAGTNQTWRINADRTGWELVADYRECMLWNKDTVSPVLNQLQLGDPIPGTVTLQTPINVEQGAPLANRWNATIEAWELVPDYSQTLLWTKETGAAYPPMETGHPLPDDATDVPPPSGGDRPVYFDDEQGRWIEHPAPEMPDYPSIRPLPPTSGDLV